MVDLMSLGPNNHACGIYQTNNKQMRAAQRDSIAGRGRGVI
jgi:hypothetical protein